MSWSLDIEGLLAIVGAAVAAFTAYRNHERRIDDLIRGEKENGSRIVELEKMSIQRIKHNERLLEVQENLLGRVKDLEGWAHKRSNGFVPDEKP